MKIAIHKIVVAAITITIISISNNLLYGDKAASKTIEPSKVEAGSKEQPSTAFARAVAAGEGNPAY